MAEFNFAPKNEFDFDKYLINLSEKIEVPAPLISLNGKPLFSRGDISCVGGKAKSCKTFLNCLLAAYFLEHTENGNIIIFDTEQSKFYSQKIPKRIHKILGWDENENCDNLKVFRLREMDTAEREKFVKEAIIHYKPDLVFVDGIRDLILDFNAPEQSSRIVNLIMKLSSVYNCHICTVLHENKEGGNLRGHLGSEIVNKCETVIGVERKGDVLEVKQKYCRNIPFDDFYFRINDEGLPEFCDQSLNIITSNTHEDLFVEIFAENAFLEYTVLRKIIMDKTKKSESTAEKYIKTAKATGIINKNKVDKYYLVSNEYEEQAENHLPY